MITKDLGRKLNQSDQDFQNTTYLRNFILKILSHLYDAGVVLPANFYPELGALGRTAELDTLLADIDAQFTAWSSAESNQQGKKI